VCCPCQICETSYWRIDDCWCEVFRLWLIREKELNDEDLRFLFEKARKDHIKKSGSLLLEDKL